MAEAIRTELPRKTRTSFSLVAHFLRRPPRRSCESSVRAGGAGRRVTGRYPCADGAELQTVATATFADRLAEAVERKRSQIVVGLDPRVELLPVELRGDPDTAGAFSRFCCGLVDAVAPSSSP